MYSCDKSHIESNKRFMNETSRLLGLASSPYAIIEYSFLSKMDL